MTGITSKPTREARKENTDPTFILSSDAFRNGGEIPPVYTCRGQGISPLLTWDGSPAGIRAFALLLEDPDAPGGTFTHWVIYNIPAEKRELPSSLPRIPSFPDGTRQGMNDFRKIGYGAPCPPPGKSHRYIFRLYAVDTLLVATPGMDRGMLLRGIRDHVRASTDLMGCFKR
jgi:Raf kinase inhibitor-like YbhB/YbcL family protein